MSRLVRDFRLAPFEKAPQCFIGILSPCILPDCNVGTSTYNYGGRDLQLIVLFRRPAQASPPGGNKLSASIHAMRYLHGYNNVLIATVPQRCTLHRLLPRCPLGAHISYNASAAPVSLGHLLPGHATSSVCPQRNAICLGRPLSGEAVDGGLPGSAFPTWLDFRPSPMSRRARGWG